MCMRICIYTVRLYVTKSQTDVLIDITVPKQHTDVHDDMYINDQAVRMCRLIWRYTIRECLNDFFSSGASYNLDSDGYTFSFILTG